MKANVCIRLKGKEKKTKSSDIFRQIVLVVCNKASKKECILSLHNELHWASSCSPPKPVSTTCYLLPVCWHDGFSSEWAGLPIVSGLEWAHGVETIGGVRLSLCCSINTPVRLISNQPRSPKGWRECSGCFSHTSSEVQGVLKGQCHAQ